MANTRFLTPEDIEKSLINLSQIVFEVTDDCNLKCVYCAYGDLYCDYDKRERKYLHMADVKPLIDYLIEIWQSNLSDAAIPETYIGFYGGEPLLNVPFIKEVIDYVESLQIKRKFKYSLTTNAVLLDRYMSFLVEKDFKLLISLDGDKNSNGYRVDSSGHNPFDIVFKNVVSLRDKYPNFYKHNVNFNSVLHDKNDVETIIDFFNKKLSKVPDLSELSPVGVKPSKREVFNKMFNGLYESFHKSNECDRLIELTFDKSPDIGRIIRYIEMESHNVYDSYDQLLSDTGKGFIPTGTCIPFSRKMFVTVNGKILPCERISHSYYFGKVSEEGLDFSIQNVVDRHNGYLKNILRCCKTCAGQNRCNKCMYEIDDLNSCVILCDKQMSLSQIENHNNNCFKYLNKKRDLYRTVLESMR